EHHRGARRPCQLDVGRFRRALAQKPLPAPCKNLFQKDRHARMRPWTLRWIAPCRPARATSTAFTVPRRPAWSMNAPTAPPILKQVLRGPRLARAQQPLAELGLLLGGGVPAGDIGQLIEAAKAEQLQELRGGAV